MINYKYSMGKPIGEFRREFEIKQERLANGLCTTNELSSIENGEHEPNVFLLLLLFQRMGLNANKYGIIYSKKECEEWIEIRNLLELVRKENIEKLKKALASYQKKWSKITYRIQLIEYFSLIGIAEKEKRKENETEKSEKELIKEAFRILLLTIPDFCMAEAKFIKGMNMFDFLENKEKEVIDRRMQFLNNLQLVLLFQTNIWQQRKT